MVFTSISTISYSNNKRLSLFRNHLEKVKLQYASSQNRMISEGDKYLNVHAAVAERMSLAEMLPVTSSSLKDFCKTYPAKLKDYYDVSSYKELAKINSQPFKEFVTLAKRGCG